MLAARRIPLDPRRPHKVLFCPELEHDLLERDDFEVLVDEVAQALSQDLEHLPRNRVGRLTGADRPVLYKYRPHADNSIRFLFTIHRGQRIVLTYFPRRNDYRPKDVRTARRRLVAWLVPRPEDGPDRNP